MLQQTKNVSVNFSGWAKCIFACAIWMALAVFGVGALQTSVFAHNPAHVTQTLIVRSLADANVAPPYSCGATCTLREAILTAGETAGPHVIEFAEGLTGEIVLVRALTINSDVTIQGPGAELLTISIPGDDFGNFRVLTVGNATVALRGLTLQRNGVEDGGGIVNNGRLTIEDSVVRNTAFGGIGGAIYNGPNATLWVHNSRLENNRGFGSGGVFIAGSVVTITNSTLIRNGSGSIVNKGVALHNDGGRLLVLDSVIMDSQGGEAVATVNGGSTVISSTRISENGRGGVYVENPASRVEIIGSELVSNTQAVVNGVVGRANSGGQITIMESALLNNRGQSGAAIVNYEGGVIVVDRSTLQGNIVTFLAGGAIVNSRATMTVTHSTLRANRVSELADRGAAIVNQNSGVFLLENSAVVGNFADEDTPQVLNDRDRCGAILNDGTNSPALLPATMTIVNSTISGNRALWGGGGLCSLVLSETGAANMVIRHSTIADNRVTAPGEDGGGGAIYVQGGTLSLEGVILAGNSDGSNGPGETLLINTETPSVVTSLGYNLSDRTLDILGPTDVVGAAVLGPLADNGGPTQTHALLAGSPALDAYGGDNCPATDQRGMARPDGGGASGAAQCDIGAFELDTEPAEEEPDEEEPDDEEPDEEEPVSPGIFLPTVRR